MLFSVVFFFSLCFFFFVIVFFFQAEDGIRDLVRSRGLGDVYKRQVVDMTRSVLDDMRLEVPAVLAPPPLVESGGAHALHRGAVSYTHLTLPTSDLV